MSIHVIFISDKLTDNLHHDKLFKWIKSSLKDGVDD